MAIMRQQGQDEDVCMTDGSRTKYVEFTSGWALGIPHIPSKRLVTVPDIYLGYHGSGMLYHRNSG